MRFALNVLIIIFLLAILYIATVHAPQIRRVLSSPAQMVAGAKTENSAEIEKEKFVQSLASDSKEQLTHTRDQIFNVRIGQIVEFIGRAGKIVQDVHHVEEGVRSIFDDKK